MWLQKKKIITWRRGGKRGRGEKEEQMNAERKQNHGRKTRKKR